MAGEHTPRGTHCDCGLSALAHRPRHEPRGFPICECGAYARSHRVTHKYEGTGPHCLRCNVAPERHIKLSSLDSDYRIEYVGIDGEGVGRKPHRYVMLCAAAHDGRRWALEDANGLKTTHALNWILETLDRCRVFAYGFGYDITCILRDLPNQSLYRLLRPGLRYSRGRLRPVDYHGYRLDWLQGKLTISRKKQRVVIWDILKFFQQTFVKSLKDWGLATDDEVDFIESMKAKRSRFRLSQMPRIKEYSWQECVKLAQLVQKLLKAHKQAGLTLRSYYGPGSTASVALGDMKVNDFTSEPPAPMKQAIASAFFGGRFEHSRMGIVKPVYAYDISSAYPYHAYHLPCLAHGRWRYVKSHVRRAISSCTTALIHYIYRGQPEDTWAPFPHRDAKGNICYPFRNEGWAWLPEIRAARGMGEIRYVAAWVYDTDCDCHPFKQIADYYRQRVALGKDAQGKVLKLAVNSVYGKLAQSKGPNPKYQNWVWAGLITSGTRAQVLHAMQSAPAYDDVIAIATDGLFSTTRLSLSRPRDTGTTDLSKPLGGWEETHHPGGILFLKPGIYLSLEDGEAQGSEATELTIKARGIGRKTMRDERLAIIEAYQRGDRSYTVVVDRFHGAKSSITQKRRSERFGQWSKMKIRVAFECPNRAPDMSLLERFTPSTPYSASLVTPEALTARLHRDITYEQP